MSNYELDIAGIKNYREQLEAKENKTRDEIRIMIRCLKIEAGIKKAQTAEQASDIICNNYQIIQQSVRNDTNLADFKNKCDKAVSNLNAPKFETVQGYLDAKAKQQLVKDVDTVYQRINSRGQDPQNIENQIKAARVMFKDHLGLNPLKRMWISRTVPYAQEMKDISSHLKNCKNIQDAYTFICDKYKAYKGKNKEGFATICNNSINKLSAGTIKSMDAPPTTPNLKKQSSSSFKL